MFPRIVAGLLSVNLGGAAMLFGAHLNVAFKIPINHMFFVGALLFFCGGMVIGIAFERFREPTITS